MDYKEIKKRGVWLGGLVLMFLVGFGTGDYVKYKTPAQSQTNYTTKAAPTPFLSAPVTASSASVSISATSSTSTEAVTKPVIDPANCLIKGNIAADGRKIFHVPGGQSYKRLIHPKQCFNTEAEAVAAGFTKAKR